MKKKIIFTFVWIITIIFSIIWTFENPEKIEKVKYSFNKSKKTTISTATDDVLKITANSFSLSVKKILNFEDKTAFLIYNKKFDKFDLKNLEIYTQSGNIVKNLESRKINLPDYFTLQRNGGVKTIISIENQKIALISANEKNCYFAALISIKDKKELFKTKCLPELPKNNDFNGLGSSNVHYGNKILLSLGTPEKHASKNSSLAQKEESKFGKILEIDKLELIDKINDMSKKLSLNVFSKGHRVPQGLTILNNKVFNVEHGPKGGDELNHVIKNKNYGWPIVSYGTNYLKDKGGDGSAYKINHNREGFEEPLFAFVPSIGISSLNNCPKILNNYYKKPCLMALSLYGNNLRKGYSLVIFLLNDELNKIDSLEKISLSNLVLRHFVTDQKNELYEDNNGDIYISVDKKGIYRVSFENFR